MLYLKSKSIIIVVIFRYIYMYYIYTLHIYIFGNKTIDGKVSVLINNKIIDRVYESKFLGVYIDSRINWNII